MGVIITSAENSISVEFNEYATFLETLKQTWNKSAIQNFRQHIDSTIYVNIRFEKEWRISYNGSVGTFKVDTINGIAPTSNNDLFTKLEALIA